MRAVAVFPRRRAVHLIEHDEPRIRLSTQIKLRMLDIGICGTDKEVSNFQYGTPPAGFEYLVIGHESLGQVVEVGEHVYDLEPGDLVVTMVRRPCTHADCRACRTGHQELCSTGDFTERGIKEAHGFMSDFVVDERQYMHRIPPELREVGVLVEPLTIAEQALSQISLMQQRLPWTAARQEQGRWGKGQRAVVLGAGPVGLLGAMLLLTAGFETYVYSYSPAPNARAALVASLGAYYLSEEVVPIEQLTRYIGNVDLIYEAVGASEIAFHMMTVLGRNGTFVFTGVPGRKAPMRVDTNLLMRNLALQNQLIFGTMNAGHANYTAAIRDLSLFMHNFPLAVQALVNRRYPLEQFQEALSSRSDGIKNVITLD